MYFSAFLFCPISVHFDFFYFQLHFSTKMFTGNDRYYFLTCLLNFCTNQMFPEITKKHVFLSILRKTNKALFPTVPKFLVKISIRLTMWKAY